MLMRLKMWTLAALVSGGALLQFGGCFGLGGLSRWDVIMLAILQEDLFG